MLLGYSGYRFITKLGFVGAIFEFGRRHEEQEAWRVSVFEVWNEAEQHQRLAIAT